MREILCGPSSPYFDKGREEAWFKILVLISANVFNINIVNIDHIGISILILGDIIGFIVSSTSKSDTILPIYWNRSIFEVAGESERLIEDAALVHRIFPAF